MVIKNTFIHRCCFFVRQSGTLQFLLYNQTVNIVRYVALVLDSCWYNKYALSTCRCTLGCDDFFQILKKIYFSRLFRLKNLGSSVKNVYFVLIYSEDLYWNIELKYRIIFQKYWIFLNWEAKNRVFFYAFQISQLFFISSSVNFQDFWKMIRYMISVFQCASWYVRRLYLKKKKYLSPKLWNRNKREIFISEIK